MRSIIGNTFLIVVLISLVFLQGFIGLGVINDYDKRLLDLETQQTIHEKSPHNMLQKFKEFNNKHNTHKFITDAEV